jgi:glycosyltransferase involved in cell wall biosynthesis
MNKVRLSLVMHTKNRVKYFERSLQSLIAESRRDYPDSEIVVVDGGSKDGTVEVLKKYNDSIARWISEPDKNISDAVNKSLKMVRGDVVRFVGDDDELEPGKLSVMMKYMDEHPDVDVLIGHTTIQFEDADGTRRHHPHPPLSVGWITKERLLRFFYTELFMPECGFFRREILEKAGGYDLRYHMYAFWDFFFRILEAGGRIYALPEKVLRTYQTLLSDTRNYCRTPAAWKERLKIARQHGGWRWAYYQKHDGRLPAQDMLLHLRRAAWSVHFHPLRALRDLKARIARKHAK